MRRTFRRIAALGAVLAFTAAIPAAAQAATLTNAGGTLTYVGGAGAARVEFAQADPAVATVTVGDFGEDPITTAAGCTGTGPYVCANVTLVVADAGAGGDSISTGFDGYNGMLQIPAHLSGGAGDDQLVGGAGADTIAGDAGDDVLGSGFGADVISGGSGSDIAYLFPTFRAPATAALPLTVTLDDVANDGSAGQGANVHTDVEDVAASSSFDDGLGNLVPAGVTVTGDASDNNLSGGGGADTITGGAGSDQLYGYLGDDTLNARDGFRDRVLCGDGLDTAVVDTLDDVSDTCENVSVADVGSVIEDKPPAIAWASPASRAQLPGSELTTLTVTATDDKAVTKVDFFDDDRVICTDTIAPYTCAYAPRGADLGRNTLTAIAFDALGQSAGSVRRVVVTRFRSPRLSLRTSAAKHPDASSTIAVRGRLTRSATVSKALNCTGRVHVWLRAGNATLASRTVRLTKSCTYRATFLPASLRGVAIGKLKLRATFTGNAAIMGRSSSRRSVN